MAIKMDGHTITSLQLKASDGSEVTKQLTEEGTIPTPTETLNINTNGERDVTNYKKVNVQVEGGGELPTLTNPASASDILSGKEALDGDGAKLTGTCTFDADTSDADATASDILQGKTAYVNGVKLLGTLVAGGGGSNIATGTFTMASQKAYLPTITHNLNSQKIVLIVWDTRSEFTATVPYQLHHMIWMNYPAITGQTSVVADFSAYNANQSAPVTWDFTSQTENNSVGAYIRSAYTSTTDAKIQNGLNDSTFCNLVNFDGWGTSSQHEITNNELKNVMCGNKNSMGVLVPNVEYRWIAIKCE